MDVLYICAELVTGKSIPVLVGITRLPVDQFLAWLMLFFGAVFGTLFSVYSSRAVAGMTLLGFTNRMVQLGFSLCLSLSMLLSVSKGIHAGRGVVLCLIPAFCIVAQNLPQRDSTALLSFALCCVLFYASMITAPTVIVMDGQPWPATSGEKTHGISVVSRSLQLFLLAFYACIQHAPTQVLVRSCNIGRHSAK